VKFESDFRNEMACFRAQKMSKDPYKYIRGTKENQPALREAIVQASKMPNLFEAETLLDKTMWAFLDDLVSGHFYDLDYIIVYGLKLKILERQQTYRTPKGRSRFDEIRMATLPESCILETKGSS